MINASIKFVDNFVCGIGNISVKFHQETLFIIQNIVLQWLWGNRNVVKGFL